MSNNNLNETTKLSVSGTFNVSDSNMQVPVFSLQKSELQEKHTKEIYELIDKTLKELAGE